MSAWTVLALVTPLWANEGAVVVPHCPQTTILMVEEQWPDVGPSRTEQYLVFEPAPEGRVINIYPAWRGQARSIEIEDLKLRIELPEGPDPCAE